MAGPFSPADTVVGPIVQALSNIVATQIPAVGYIYQTMPDRPPADDAVIMPLMQAQIIDDTSGKLTIKLSFAMRHLFRRTNLADDIARAYTYIMPWLFVLSAWTNQSVSGLALKVNPKIIKVIQVTQAGQAMVALAIDFDVITEFNIVVT